MAADVGLVAHAAQRDADEVSAHRLGDRFAERSLADAGRADEAQDRAAAVGFELAHGEIFDDAALDLVQVVMIAIEDLARLGQVDLVVGFDRPRQLADGSAATCGSRRTPGEALGIDSSRVSSRSASFITFSGSLAASSFSRSCSTSLPPPPPSPSPSSLRIAFICSCR